MSIDPIRDPVLTAEAELRSAMLAGDVDALDRLLDADLVFTGLDGRVIGKAADLDAHRTGRLRLSRLDPSERHVVRCGPTVVVSVRVDLAGTYDGEPTGGAYRYTRV